MAIDAGRANSEGPTRSNRSESAKVVGESCPSFGSSRTRIPNELIDVLLETHGSISQAVLRIPGAIAAPALGRARDAFYWKMDNWR